jgi:hypothetical protein
MAMLILAESNRVTLPFRRITRIPPGEWARKSALETGGSTGKIGV